MAVSPDEDCDFESRGAAALGEEGATALSPRPEGLTARGGTATPPEGREHGSGRVPPVGNQRWLITASNDDSDECVLADLGRCEWYAMSGGLALVKARGKCYSVMA
eukprot:1441262-Pyramimonas_sp.AAC.1